MLRLEDVHAGYGPIAALKGISLEVNAGEIVALIGANGAGKSTALMTISGVIRAARGCIRFGEREIQQLPADQIVGLGISHVPEGRRIFPRLTVRENLEMGAFRRTDRADVARDLDQVYAHFGFLRERAAQPGGTLSGGEQQMLAIGRALMARPRLLLLDEPSLGLAPMIVQRIFGIIREINRDGKTVLLVEQNARAALTLAHRGYVLETGRIVMQAEAKALLADARVKAAYLGEG
jgi:branched-chain amino acid transport system ATP-binding protein